MQQGSRGRDLLSAGRLCSCLHHHHSSQAEQNKCILERSDLEVRCSQHVFAWHHEQWSQPVLFCLHGRRYLYHCNSSTVHPAMLHLLSLRPGDCSGRHLCHGRHIPVGYCGRDLQPVQQAAVHGKCAASRVAAVHHCAVLCCLRSVWRDGTGSSVQHVVSVLWVLRGWPHTHADTGCVQGRREGPAGPVYGTISKQSMAESMADRGQWSK